MNKGGKDELIIGDFNMDPKKIKCIPGYITRDAGNTLTKNGK